MKCESCNEREATIAFTRIAGDDKQVLRLCAHCAEQIARQEKGTGKELGQTPQGKTPTPDGPAPTRPAKPSHSGQDPAAGAPSGKPPVAKVSVVVGNLSASDKTAACAECGMTYEEFRKVGRFGCAACYFAFAAHLDRLLKRVHGATRHTGRSPSPRAERTAAPDPGPPETAPAGPEQIEALRAQLAEAVAAEAYERAADLRDRIAQLERKDPAPEAEAGPAPPSEGRDGGAQPGASSRGAGSR